MQVSHGVVGWIQVDVMHDIALSSLCYFAMFPFAATSVRPISETVTLHGKRLMGSASLFYRWIDRRFGFGYFGDWAHHLVPTPFVLPWRKSINFLFVRKQGVPMLAPHLVMTHAHFPSYCGPITKLTRASNDLPAPSILWRAIFLNALVVHQAVVIRCVLAFAALNATLTVLLRGRHGISYCLIRYKALGNSMAVPVMRWIGQRIDLVNFLFYGDHTL